MLSRNFRLQKVGDFNWLRKYYNFEKIASSIDELIILDVTREGRNIDDFSLAIKDVIKNVFVPVAAGGGIRSITDAEVLLNSGADKIVLNTSLYNDKNLIIELIKIYGSQFIVGSVDYATENGMKNVYIENGTLKINQSLEDYIVNIENLSIGEIYLNSIKKDGTGQGYDILALSVILDRISTPVILSGGAGNHFHLIEGLQKDKVDAVATANLFNFIGDALPNSRNEILNKGIDLAKFKDISTLNIKFIVNGE